MAADLHYSAGGDLGLRHRRELGRGGSGTVHEVEIALFTHIANS